MENMYEKVVNGEQGLGPTTGKAFSPFICR